MNIRGDHQPQRVVTLAVLVWCLLTYAAVFEAAAQQLPIQRYRVADGLAHDRIQHIYQDRYNYLWISTYEGLSRFDGYRFVNYDRRHGLGHQVVNFVTEDRRGRLWVATNGGGVARLIDEERVNTVTWARPTPEKKFVSYLVDKDPPWANAVNAMVFDADNSLWCATDAGLFRGREDASGKLTFELIEEGRLPIAKTTALVDRRGRLWFGIRKTNGTALVIGVVSGQVFKYVLTSNPLDDVTAVSEDARGRVLATTWQGRLHEFIEPDAPGGGRWTQLPLNLAPNLHVMYADASGTLWMGTNMGLIKYRDGTQTHYTPDHGLSGTVVAITADREGNLWLGTGGNGLCKLSAEEIISFTRTEGLPANLESIFEGRNGRVYAFAFGCCAVELTVGRVSQIPGLESPPLNELYRSQILHDRWGDWWLATPQGLYRFTGPEPQFRRGEKMNASFGLPEQHNLFRIFETSDGRVWLFTFDGVMYQLELRPHPRILQQFTLKDLNSVFIESPIVMNSDNRGALWLATFNHGFGRLFNGRLDAVQPTEGLPESEVRAFFQDSRGWLWIGLRNHGVSLIKDLNVEPLRFVNYSIDQGLPSDTVRSITEDNFGRIYLATGKGLAQIDPGSNRIRILNTGAGLAGDEVLFCFKDSQGQIWTMTSSAVSRLTPRPLRPPAPPPPVYLSRVSVAGDELGFSERGTQRLPYFEVTASRNNVLVEYVAVSFRGGTRIRYQYKLDGIDAGWSATTEQRSVNYARLAPGSYRFMARAINEEGLPSVEPALIEFRVLPPFYLRWWFITAVATALGLAIYALYRIRVRRLIEIERVRTRIATDLHDDVGASLSLVAMLSEVAKQQAARGDAKAFDSLSSIAGVARELVDSTSDIVWAVNPRKDRVSELVKRMRRFASDAFGSRDVLLRFTAPNHDHDFPLGADARREIFFVFKESVNNIARHAGCSEAEVTLSFEGGWLILKLRDNGKGFDPSQQFGGNGLDSMRHRAIKLGGEYSVVSQPGSGCETTLSVPLPHRGFR